MVIYDYKNRLHQKVHSICRVILYCYLLFSHTKIAMYNKFIDYYTIYLISHTNDNSRFNDNA